MMKLLIDTNVIIDLLLDREPYAEHAEKLIDLCADGEFCGVLTASAVTDVYYVIRKKCGHNQALEQLRLLFTVVQIADVGKTDIQHALEQDMPDFEDALVSACAKRIKADFIVTRNIKDFAKSAIDAITPQDFLQRFYPE